VLYVTERCVFRLHERGLELTEVAPGLDLERDILAHMRFRPVIDREPATMDPAIFADSPMGLRARLLMVPLADRFTFDVERSTMFINFERLAVRTPDDVEAVRQQVERHVAPLGQRVYAIVNYDHFHLDGEVEDDWAQMVRELEDRFYLNVTRYTTSGFLRAKLGPSLAARGVAPHLYESSDEARAHVRGA
jgi:propionate CoA-transferase